MATKARKAATKKSKTAKKASSAGLPIKSVLAVANMQPPGPFSLYVRAKISVPTPGYRAYLKKAVPQGINPKILILDVVLEKLLGIWPQRVTDIDATYDEKPYHGAFTDVTVRYKTASKTQKIMIVV